MAQPEWLGRAATRCFILSVQSRTPLSNSPRAEGTATCANCTQPRAVGPPSSIAPSLPKVGEECYYSANSGLTAFPAERGATVALRSAGLALQICDGALLATCFGGGAFVASQLTRRWADDVFVGDFDGQAVAAVSDVVVVKLSVQLANEQLSGFVIDVRRKIKRETNKLALLAILCVGVFERPFSGTPSSQIGPQSFGGTGGLSRLLSTASGRRSGRLR